MIHDFCTVLHIWHLVICTLLPPAAVTTCSCNPPTSCLLTPTEQQKQKQNLQSDPLWSSVMKRCRLKMPPFVWSCGDFSCVDMLILGENTKGGFWRVLLHSVWFYCLFCMSTDELPASVCRLTRQMKEACGELVVSWGQDCRINCLTACLLPPCWDVSLHLLPASLMATAVQSEWLDDSERKENYRVLS